MSRRTLVIGIGNPLRGDDGVGWRLVEDLEATSSAPGPSLDLRAVHQLTPELAVDLASSERVLFIDAWVPSPGQVGGGSAGNARPCLRALSPQRPAAQSAARSHHLDPEALLAMTASLFGVAPGAHLLQVPAFSFAFGMELSPALQVRLPLARVLLRQWLGDGSGRRAAAASEGVRPVDPHGQSSSPQCPRTIRHA